MSEIISKFDNKNNFLDEYISIINNYKDIIKKIEMGGGPNRIQAQHNKKRLTARERIKYLIDDNSIFFEIGVFAAYGMYEEYGGAPSSGVIGGICKISNKNFIVIANDATVKAGSYFEMTLKKTLRLQELSLKHNIPIIYLVDSAGVFLPMQDQVFPDEGHFGKIFYNNAIISSKGISQIACVMGPCVAGGAYLPVMCDKYIMTEGSSMFLAGPSLVKAAIGQETDIETLGGATTHSSISGIVDYHEKDDYSALDRIKNIVNHINFENKLLFPKTDIVEPKYNFEDIPKNLNFSNLTQYDMSEILARIIDGSNFEEYKANYGKSIICGHCKIGGFNVGVVANQKNVIKTNDGKIQLGGVIYNDSADKAARFVMNCNQDKIPLLFIHDVNGFMVGKDAEMSGIAKDGAKLVNAVSNCTVPKITLIIGGSYGAGNYALSGKAYNPNFIFAWPTAKIAVMGGEQAAKTLTNIKLSKMDNVSNEEENNLYNKIKAKYDEQSDIKYAAARLWIDNIIFPEDTRYTIIKSLNIINNSDPIKKASYGVLQV